jgi:hypothetical protein
MCNTSAPYLTWIVTIPESSNISLSRFISITAQKIRPLEFSGNIFNISRLSTNGTLPLISLLSIANTDDLNGTKVGCLAQFGDNNSLQMVSTIHVIRSGADGKFN